MYERKLIVQLHRLPFCRRKLWEGHPWEFSRTSILYGCGKTGNLL